jgi:hypothetical protein
MSGEITVRYSSVDSYGKAITRKFKTMKGASKFARKWVGDYPDLGSTYAVSFDGVGKVTVEGCTIKELFAVPVEPVEASEAPDFDNPGKYAEYFDKGGSEPDDNPGDDEMPF